MQVSDTSTSAKAAATMPLPLKPSVSTASIRTNADIHGTRRSPGGTGWINLMDVASSPSPFYTNGTFWAGACAVVGVVSILAIGWVTWRAANPKRRLWYSMPTVTPLVRRGKEPSRELKIIYGDHQLESPSTVNIQFISKRGASF